MKELMICLDFLSSGKGNVSQIFKVSKNFYWPEKEDTFSYYHLEFKKTYEELNMLLPFCVDIKV